MNATLYIPGTSPELVSNHGLVLPTHTGLAQSPTIVAEILGCTRELVDVLDFGPNYAAYSIFDYEGDTNELAMEVLSTISGHQYDVEDDDDVLQGPILIVTD